MASGRWRGRPFARWAGAGAGLFPAAAGAAPFPLLNEAALDARALLIGGIFAGVIFFSAAAAAIFLRGARRAGRAEARAKSVAGELDRQRDLYQSVLSAEPQILLYWDTEGTPALAADTLGADLGVPREAGELLRYAAWLERESARELEERVLALRSEGQPFNLMLRTAAGAHVEADGRAAGGGTVLKIRDLAGNREQLARVADRHRQMRQDIGAMRALLDALPMPVWLRDARGRLDWVNRAYAQAVDAADADTVRREQIELLEREAREAARRNIAMGESWRARLNLAVGGEQRPFEAIVLPVGAESAGVAIDLGAREDGGGQDEDGARTLDRIPMAVAVFSPRRKLTYFNQAFAALWGLDVTWLAGGPSHGELLDHLRERGLLPEQADYREWKAKQLDVHEGRQPAGDDWWHLPDGRTVHVIADRDGDGTLICLFENLTEQLALQSQFNTLMRVQKETLDHLREGVAVFASSGRLRLYNPAFARIWKLDGALLQREPHIDEVIAGSQSMLSDAASWDAIKGCIIGINDQRSTVEGQLDRPDGSVLAYAGLPLPDGATLLTYVDITDSKRIENALIERNEALVAADRLKTAFISHVSYELRTPLTNIIGFTELLGSDRVGPLNDKQREYLNDIGVSSGTLLSIINDILDLASIDAGGLELRRAPVGVKNIIQSALLSVSENMRAAGLKLDVHVADENAVIEADAKRVIQVLYNLLTNAVGFSARGATVTLTCAPSGGMVAFTVEDQGPGIPEAEHQAVFERFESKARGSRHRGAGLGLSIVRSLVELHGGDVRLQSSPGVGTRVTVRFPVSAVHAPAAGARPPAAAAG